MKDRFQQAKAHADRHGGQVVVLFLDIDQFKQVNDRFGHTVGDSVLQTAAARLQAIVRASDTACRFGGDEFIVLLTDVDDCARSSHVAEEIRRRLADPYRMDASSIALHPAWALPFTRQTASHGKRSWPGRTRRRIVPRTAMR